MAEPRHPAFVPAGAVAVQFSMRQVPMRQCGRRAHCSSQVAYSLAQGAEIRFILPMCGDEAVRQVGGGAVIGGRWAENLFQ